MHFTPTHGAWLNLVEGWFALLTERALRRGVHCSVREMEEAINNFLDAHNDDPVPFEWSKTADEIPDNIKRFAQTTYDIHGPNFS